MLVVEPNREPEYKLFVTSDLSAPVGCNLGPPPASIALGQRSMTNSDSSVRDCSPKRLMLKASMLSGACSVLGRIYIALDWLVQLF